MEHTIEIDLSKLDFQEDVELDAQLFYANHLAGQLPTLIEAGMAFREASKALGITDPVQGIARGLWLMGVVSPEYAARVKARTHQLIAMGSVVN